MTIFESLAGEFGNIALACTFLVMFLGGFTKGVVGFALPMITISGIGSLMNADIAILSLLLPGLITNVWQSFRSGFGGANEIIRRFWRIFLVMPIALAAAAQVFTMLDDRILFLVLGVVVIGFVVLDMGGFRGVASGKTPKLEYAIGLTSGISGGLSGVWGPPIMVYLMARDIKKAEFVQTMGLVFLIGAIVLNLSHINSGLLNSHTAPMSAAMLIPALAGMWLGYRVQDNLDQEKFRRATLFVLLFAGLNLIRRGIM